MKPEPSNIPLPSSLDEWLAERSEDERRALGDAWERAEQGRIVLTDADRSRKAKVWMAVQQQMNEAVTEDVPRPPLRLVKSHPFRWIAAAATIVLLFGVGYLFRPVTVDAPRGSFAEVKLPDGSLVQLNSESSITYPARFFGSRNVSLEGEAFFEVTKDDEHFVVETFNARTTVLGTSFNVRARPDEDQANTAVVVAEGAVRVAAKVSDEGSVTLAPGQQSRVHGAARTPTEPEPVALSRRLAWRTGGLAFTDQPFALIFGEIERRFDIEIEASDDLLAKPFSFYVNSPGSAESVLSDLARAEGFRYRATSGGYEVYRP